MLIGIVGFIGSGKGTVGDYLESSWQFKKDSFANPLKDALSIIFGWDRELLEGQTKESREWREKIDYGWSKIIGKEISPRIAMQLFGTECIRNVFHPNVWSASLIKRYETFYHDVVVTDCRFKNEIKSIKDAGGYIIKVKRGDNPEWYERYKKHINNPLKIKELRDNGIIPHVSETDWIGSKFDIIIENNNSLMDLYANIDINMHILYNMKNRKI